jgi:hypothetical protein
MNACAVCHGKGYGTVWDVPLCLRCICDWADEPAPTHGDIEAKYGKDADTCGVYREFTKRWLEKRLAKARAA